MGFKRGIFFTKFQKSSFNKLEGLELFVLLSSNFRALRTKFVQGVTLGSKTGYAFWGQISTLANMLNIHIFDFLSITTGLISSNLGRSHP
jgi:hypothetical protein